MTEQMEAAPVTTLTPVRDGLAVEQQREAGMNAFARMNDAEFGERLRSLRVGMERFQRMTSEVLKVGKGPDADLRIIPGVEKPVLTLSAAEKLCFVARLAPSFLVDRTAHASRFSSPIPDEFTQPAIHYLVTCRLHLGNTEGPVIAEGVGSCSSHEKKYRWRFAEKGCPECGSLGTLILSKWEDKDGPFVGVKPWLCFAKKGGCGAKFPPDEPRILSQKMGMVENEEPHDLDNTLLKMAKKRAFVDATKTATCTSGLVTADMEEGQPDYDVEADRAAIARHDEARDAIFERARLLKWTTLGPIFECVQKATGKAIKLRKELDALATDDLQRVLASMPAAPSEEHAAPPAQKDEEYVELPDDPRPLWQQVKEDADA